MGAICDANIGLGLGSIASADGGAIGVDAGGRIDAGA